MKKPVLLWFLVIIVFFVILWDVTQIIGTFDFTMFAESPAMMTFLFIAYLSLSFCFLLILAFMIGNMIRGTHQMVILAHIGFAGIVSVHIIATVLSIYNVWFYYSGLLRWPSFMIIVYLFLWLGVLKFYSYVKEGRVSAIRQ
jgi:hypothetical protein